MSAGNPESLLSGPVNSGQADSRLITRDESTDWMARRKGKPKRAIVLSGGGARGAYEAGVLRFILDELPKRTGIEPDFEIV